MQALMRRKTTNLLLQFLALAAEAADRTSFWWAGSIASITSQRVYFSEERRHLGLQLVGEVVQNADTVLQRLENKNTNNQYKDKNVGM